MNVQAADKIMSVIVPVYNKSEYIDNCIMSLVEQTADSSTFEVLLVDDGSTDSSLEKCRAYEARYDFVRVISQENQGVSGARNTGLRNARGTYILFLDADDVLSSNAIERTISMFEQLGDAVDVVASRLRYHSKSDGHIADHARRRWLPESGFYSLEKHPNIAQSTMNICIRNRFEDNILFDTDLKMGEDQLFVTMNLARKAAIGYCDDVEYAYSCNILSASQTSNGPLYAYGDMLVLFKRLLDLAESNERMRRYAYGLILYNLDWRLRSDRLDPYHLEGSERERADKALAGLLGAIPHNAYAASPYLNAHHKAALLEKYVHPGDRPLVEHSDKKTLVTFSDGATWGTAKAKVVVEQLVARAGVLRLQGRVTCPAFRFEGRPEVRIAIDGFSQLVELTDSSFSYAGTKQHIGCIWWLECSLDLGERPRHHRVHMELLVNGGSIPFELTTNLRDCNARIIDNVYYFPHTILSFGGNEIAVEVKKASHPKRLFFDENRRNRSAKALRTVIKRESSNLKGRRVWIYADNPTAPDIGDSLLQMLNDCSREDGVERFYVSNHFDQLVSAFPELTGRVVALGSGRHKALSVLASLFIFSGAEADIRKPSSKDELAGVGDLARPQKSVFLPNGVLHALKPWELSRDRLLADAIVASTHREVELFEKLYGYPRGAIISSGLPRFDRPAGGCSGESGRLLLAPSWRSNLLAGSGRTAMPIDAELEKSAFFKGLQALVDGIEAKGFVADNALTLDIKVHPRFACYNHMFEKLCRRGVRLVGGAIDLRDYDVVITDYSSYVFDAAYAGCKILYFIPDYQEFRSGMHEYREVDPSLECGFGPLCTDPDDAIEHLRVLLNGGLGEVGRKFASVDEAFIHGEGGSRERLYRALSEVDD